MNMRRVASAVAATAIAAGGMVASSGTAEAARISCYASSCNHLNPYKTTCAGDAIRPLPGAKDSDGSVVYLYYSPSCRATWAETWSAPYKTRIVVYRDGGSLHSEDWATYGAHTWTGMINDAGYKSFAVICPPDGLGCAQTSSY
ncbi:MAG: DUF2690 domain-containing protein [Streptomyces sp.]|uniref:DUF2690 domain-containing protein n=1 Tax=Streptomyces sp. TaxID=1931 RepID=UPI0025DB2751|nr:DUF2690 domain-containing protein [Streptomyces sp.]MBW8795943.1 DUF2690 domain-containing protein [Streptomyces sp.]